MQADKKGSVNIRGAGIAGGGEYENISISGSGKITGDVRATQIKISGAGKIQGNVQADSLSASGAFKIEGDLEVKDIKCSGAGKIGGKIKTHILKASGALKVSGNITANEVEISGAGNFGEDVQAESFRCRGALSIAGLLNADKVELALGKTARIREIGGGEITIVHGSENSGLFSITLTIKSPILEAESIEGDDIYLENTHAKVVRGRRIKIGPQCQIASVDYSETLEIDPSAQVAAQNYVGEAPAQQSAQIHSLQPPEGWAKQHRSRYSACSIQLCGHEIQNPLARFIAAFLGILIAAVVIGGVVFLVLPMVGLFVALVLGGVALLLLLLAIGLPFLLAGAGLVELMKLPFRSLRWRSKG